MQASPVSTESPTRSPMGLIMAGSPSHVRTRADLFLAAALYCRRDGQTAVRRVRVSSASARREHAPASFHGILESFLHRPQSLNEFELLSLRPLAVDQGPAVRLALCDLVGVRVERSGLAFLFRGHRDHAIGSHLGHASTRGFRFEIVNKLVEVDIVANVEAEAQRPGISRARLLVRRRETGTTALRLLLVAVLQEFDD